MPVSSKAELKVQAHKELNEQMRLKMAYEGMKMASKMVKLKVKKRKCSKKHGKKRSPSPSSSSSSSSSSSNSDSDVEISPDGPDQSSSSMTA
jgi:hypothetical protein